jgi:hypothetical protein
MKKSITILALAFGISGAFAQDLTSKKGEQILPEAEDWSIGVDATPFLNYMGNFFGKSSNNTAPTFGFLNSSSSSSVSSSSTGGMIMGKKFVEAQKAYRAALRIGFGTTTTRQMVTDRFAAATASATPPPNNYPTANKEVENAWKHSTTNIGLAVGMENRRGKTRLQGYYGGEVGINFTSSKDKFTYGNKLNPFTTAGTTTANPSVDVTTADQFSGAGNVITVPTANSPTGRVTERKNGSVFTFGVRGFVGVEYFVLPKISLGGEFGWALGLSTQGKSTTKAESNSDNGLTADETTGTTTIEGSKNGSFKLDTDNANSIFGPVASLRLNFHF